MVKQFEVEFDEKREEFRIVSNGWTKYARDGDSVIYELEEWIANSVRG